MSVTTPFMSPDHNSSQHLPQEKSKKYDRQLRLWGDDGQAALESCKICLINATATGTEILKNLILPGIGSFTIVDGHKVRGEDVGNNFFLDVASIGKSRAAHATKYLLELNEDVSGDYIDEYVDNILDSNSIFFSNFSLIIATNLTEKTLLRLADQLWQWNIPLLVCCSYGLAGYIRLVIREHTIVESHPDSALDDLRLDNPFPALVSFCDSQHLDKMTKKEHSHTPWLVILYKFLQQWKTEHDGHPPKNFQEKKLLKDMIRKGVRCNEEGIPDMEENFDEAILHVNTALQPLTVPKEVEDIFTDDSCVHLTSESSSYWILARALKEFVLNEGKGHLPVRGSIPDMTADSERYIQLQNIYRERAHEDTMIISGHVSALLQNLGRDQPRPKRQCRSPSNSPQQADIVTEADIAKFCHNSAFLRVLRGQSLQSEYDSTAPLDGKLRENPDLNVYVLLRAISRFQDEFGRLPGCGEDWESDLPKLKTSTCQFSPTVDQDFLHEFCRYEASELPCVAALIGGAAAQEVIKVVTHQFVPIDNTFLYNAVTHTSCTVHML